MSELSKQALKVDNNTSFPNNTTNYITPAILRAFNVNVIDSVVVEETYQPFTQSVLQSLDALDAFTASLNTSFDALDAFTASAQISITALNANTASQQVSIDNLNAATSSYATSAITASSIITASVNNDDITFTKGDGSQFTIQVATGSFAVSASYADNAATASISRNVVIIARNGNASTLPAGTVVRITSAVGDNPIFNTASYDDEANSSNTLGILRYSTATGADSEVVVQGTVLGVNTNGYTAGQVLYLSSSGQFTNVQPQAPLQIVTLGEVLRVQQNNGSIYVNISNGWELNELHNVQITSPTTGQLLAYESASYGLWKNKSASTLGLATTGSNLFIGAQNISGAVSATGNGLFGDYTVNQYPALQTKVSTAVNPGNIYSTIGINNNGDSVGSAGIYASTFTSFGSGLITGIYGGGTGNKLAGDGGNTAIYLHDSVMEIVKDTKVSGSLEVSSSLKVNGSNVVVSSQTGSFITESETGSFATLLANTFNGNQTISGSLTTNAGAEFGNRSAQYNSLILKTSLTNFPGNLYNTLGIDVDNSSPYNAGLYISTYTGFGSNPVAALYGGGNGNNTDGSNTSMVFANGDIFIQKDTSITGSLSVTGSIGVRSGSYSGQAVNNITPVSSSQSAVQNIVTLTAAEYALITPTATTLYIVI